MPSRDTVRTIMVRLTIGYRPALYIWLASDGSINRSGTGEAGGAEEQTFSGERQAGLFHRLRDRIPPRLMERGGGSSEAPASMGESRELAIGFGLADGTNRLKVWSFGPDMSGPPPEAEEFMAAAIEVTDPWFSLQKRQAERG